MKKKLSLTVLTCCTLFAFSDPIKAEDIKNGDVFYCESIDAAFIAEYTDWKFRTWEKQRFKFKVINEKTIKFDDKSYMSGTHFDIDFSLLGLLSASAEFGQSFSFENNKRFNYAHASNVSIYIMSGTCENF